MGETGDRRAARGSPVGGSGTGHRIEVRGLRVLGRHGVGEEERAQAQPFDVDLDVWTDADRAVAHDDLAETVDYDAVCRTVVSIVAGPYQYLLLETLASDVARQLLAAHHGITGLEVTVRKLRPPVPFDVASVGVSVSRWRDREPAGDTPSGPAEVPGSRGPGGRSAVRAFLGLGSNMGDRRANLRQGVDLLQRHGDVVAVSPLYETSPVGGPPQDPYLNVVVELLTEADPHQLLARCQEMEAAAGRQRAVRFGPRTLDADVLLVGDETVHDEDLVVPHPRMWERRFVLEPLSDLAPELVAPEVTAAASGAVWRLGIL